MSDVVEFTHMLPNPFVVLPQVGGVASDGLPAFIFEVTMYSSAATVEELACTLYATAKRPKAPAVADSIKKADPDAPPGAVELAIMKPPSVNEVDPEANKMNLSAINMFSVFWKLAVPATVKSPVTIKF